MGGLSHDMDMVEENVVHNIFILLQGSQRHANFTWLFKISVYLYLQQN